MPFGNNDMPFMSVIENVLKDLKTWGLKVIIPVAIVAIIAQIIKANTGGEDELKGAKKRIKQIIMLAAGVYFLIWFTNYLVSKMALVNPGNTISSITSLFLG